MPTDPGAYDLRDAFTGEDVAVVCTVAGSGSISGWTVAGYVWKPDGTSQSGVTCAVTDASAREVTLSVTGVTLATGRYRWSIWRTDTGSRTLLAWGFLTVLDEETA